MPISALRFGALVTALSSFACGGGLITAPGSADGSCVGATCVLPANDASSDAPTTTPKDASYCATVSTCGALTPLWNATACACEACPSATPYFEPSRNECVNCAGAAPYWNPETDSCVATNPGPTVCAYGPPCPTYQSWSVSSCACIPNSHPVDASEDAPLLPPPPPLPPSLVCSLSNGGSCAAGNRCSAGPCQGATAEGEESCTCVATSANSTQLTCECITDGGPPPPPTCTVTSCPANSTFDPATCACLPGTNAPTSCTIPGFGTCAIDTYCDYGICPDGKTPYGCYCQSNGIANCSNNCPPPANDASVACYIPNYGYCAPETECKVGMCPDGVTPVECYCMADGTTQCTTQCPPADAG